MSVGAQMQEGRGREEKRMNNDDNTIGIYTGRHSCTVYSDQKTCSSPKSGFSGLIRYLPPSFTSSTHTRAHANIPHGLTSTLTSSQLLLFPVHGMKSDDERAKARSAITAHQRREFSFSVYIMRHSNLQQ